MRRSLQRVCDLVGIEGPVIAFKTPFGCRLTCPLAHLAAHAQVPAAGLRPGGHTRPDYSLKKPIQVPTPHWLIWLHLHRLLRRVYVLEGSKGDCILTCLLAHLLAHAQVPAAGVRPGGHKRPDYSLKKPIQVPTPHWLIWLHLHRLLRRVWRAQKAIAYSHAYWLICWLMRRSLQRVCDLVGTKGEALLEANKPESYRDTVNGRSMAVAGCEPILHMRGFQQTKRLPHDLEADIYDRLDVCDISKGPGGCG